MGGTSRSSTDLNRATEEDPLTGRRNAAEVDGAAEQAKELDEGPEEQAKPVFEY